MWFLAIRNIIHKSYTKSIHIILTTVYLPFAWLYYSWFNYTSTGWHLFLISEMLSNVTVKSVYAYVSFIFLIMTPAYIFFVDYFFMFICKRSQIHRHTSQFVCNVSLDKTLLLCSQICQFSSFKAFSFESRLANFQDLLFKIM